MGPTHRKVQRDLPRSFGVNTGSSEECHHPTPKHIEAPHHAPDHPVHTLHRIIWRIQSLHARRRSPSSEHSPDRPAWYIPLHVGSFGELRSRSFLPKCHLSSFKLRVLTPTPCLHSHAMSSLHHQELPRDLAQNNTSVLASQAEEPMLTLLASTSTRAVLHFTSRGTYVGLACIPDLAHKPRNQC